LLPCDLGIRLGWGFFKLPCGALRAEHFHLEPVVALVHHGQVRPPAASRLVGLVTTLGAPEGVRTPMQTVHNTDFSLETSRLAREQLARRALAVVEGRGNSGYYRRSAGA
jgi:hypothetical protein